MVDDMILTMIEKVLTHYKYEGEYKVILAFTDKNNFRKKILPSYKANRAGKRKPLGYFKVRDWLMENYYCKIIENLEADDVIGLIATSSNAIIVSGDKDFKSVPGKFYDFCRDEFYEISEEEANYNHLYQNLVGDTADNYKGCPGVGPVSAKKILDANPTWEAVVEQFKKKGLTEEDALVQARVAFILRDGYYIEGKINLWR